MTEGATVIVTQVNVTDMSLNSLYMDVLKSKNLLYLAKSAVKMNVSICAYNSQMWQTLVVN